MAITETITCDVCKKPKQEVNHWLMRDLSGDFLLHGWDDLVIAAREHICGAECAVKALSEWMAYQAKKG